jgi:rhamnosyl/mannosyltransferase
MVNLPGHAIFVGADASVRRTELIALAEAYHVAERVHFVGAQSEADLRAYYHAADMLILPSVERSEAFGIVQVEAQAAGLPVICTELGTGTSYVTLHERTGFVVPPNDVPALVHAVRTLIEQPELARALGSAGLARARAEFGLTRMLDRIETIYEDALQDA